MGEVTVDITGYRQLSDDEQECINAIKEKAEEVGQMVSDLRSGGAENPHDQRWISIGATNLQQGFMALVRGVARPETF